MRRLETKSCRQRCGYNATQENDRVCHFGFAKRRGKTETMIGHATWQGGNDDWVNVFDDRKACVTQKHGSVCHFGLATRRGKTKTMIGCANVGDQMAINIDIFRLPRDVVRTNTDRVCTF